MRIDRDGFSRLKLDQNSTAGRPSRADGSIKVNNLVVEPAVQGRGYSRVLME